ncbi:glycosyltransferase family 2 protein [Prevotella dentasini]|uniref:glycosyltransferase family 2 protein n=1 Tax=Prevotella dentasini TaxID=589537 RepID=UPI000468C307|nr:glycosyltransferase family 2 protein [Prevotella dentasini]
MKPRLAIVIPCYNEEEVLPETVRRLTILLETMEADGRIAPKSRMILVDDGSADATWSLIEQYSKSVAMVMGVRLAGNSGHQNALMAGLNVAKNTRFDAIVSVDADLQDDINAIPEMVDRFSEGCDIVYGVRKSRATDTAFKRNTALFFYTLMQWLGVKSVYNHADYRLMSLRAVTELCQYRERNLFLRGIVPLLGYRTAMVYYDRNARFAGESKYPLRKMLEFAVNGITSFSVKPVRMVLGMGFLFLFIALCILVYVVHSLLEGTNVPGWASLILSVWFVGGCILIGLGIVGEYVGKIYIEVKDRPRYNIEKTTDTNEN